MSLDSKWSFSSATLLDVAEYGMCMTTNKKKMFCKPLHKASNNNWSVICKIWIQSARKIRRNNSYGLICSHHGNACVWKYFAVRYFIILSCRFHKNKKKYFFSAFTTQWTDEERKKEKQRQKCKQSMKKNIFYQSRGKCGTKRGCA